MIYDLIVIGLGPAGYAASIYAKRGGLNVLVLEGKMPGGLLNTTNIINNYPGFNNISGPDLSERMFEHFNSFNIDYKHENVNEVYDEGNIKTVITRKNTYKTKNVIIATGRSRRSLGLQGEKELQGSGISYCALCDGELFKNKDVAVVGAGDSSLEEALYLSNIVNHVTIIVRKNRLAGNQMLIDSVTKKDNISIRYETEITELKSNNGMLTSVLLSDGSELKVSGLFVYIGFDPIIPFKTNFALDNDHGYILTDENMQTNISGIYAAGDIVKKRLYQIISAETEGALAATDIVAKLTK